MKPLTWTTAFLCVWLLCSNLVVSSWGQSLAGIEALREKTKGGRVVRVIAQLKSPPEGLTTMALANAQSALSNVMKKAGVIYAKPIKDLPFLVLSVDEQKLNTLVESSQIAGVFEDKINKAYLAESVPLIEAPPTWDLGFTGEGQVVAILDTGVESTHPFLANKVVAEACFSSNFADHGATSVCPNNQEEQIGAGAGRPCPIEGCDHGTHVAGIAAGKGETFSGVAPDAKIIAVQVFSKFTDQSGGPHVCADVGAPSPCALTYTSDQIQALQHVRSLTNQFTIASVNMSLGGGHHTTFCDSDVRKDSIDQLRNVGIATIIASGNDHFTDGVGDPACISTAMTVGATSKSDVVANFSNSSPLVDVLAPGVDIRSSVLHGNFADFNGTSMATPHVAGAWALLKSQTPPVSLEVIEQRLISTGKLITDARNGVTKPRIAVRRAMSIPETKVDLLLEKTATPTQVSPGGALTYSLIVRNNSAVEATNVTLTDHLSSSTQFSSASLPACQHQNGTVTCPLGSLAGQAQQTVTISVLVNESSESLFTNTAEVSSDQEDSHPGNNQASVQTHVVLEGQYCRVPQLPIPDNAPQGLTDTLHIADHKPISVLKVALDIDHTWVGDLQVTLKHVPTNTRVTLVDRPGVPPGNGCAGDHVSATFEDSASEAVEGTCASQPPAIQGHLTPQEPLAAFIQHDLHGDWELVVSDHAGSDTGFLKKWCLIAETPFQEIEVAPPPTKGHIENANQQNRYVFQVTQPGSYRIVVTGTPQLRVSLRNANNPDLIIADNGEGSEVMETVNTQLLPGTYHVVVAPLNAQQVGDYTIQVQAQGE